MSAVATHAPFAPLSGAAAPAERASQPRRLELEILRTGPWGQIAIAVLALGIMPVAYVAVLLPKRLIDLLRTAEIDDPDCMLKYQLIGCVAVGLLVLAVHGAAKYLLNLVRIQVAERMRRRLRVAVLRDAGGRAGGGAERRRGLGPVLTQELEIIGGLASELIATPLLQAGTLIVVLTFLASEHTALALLSAVLVVFNLVALRPLQMKSSAIARERLSLVRHLNGNLIDAEPVTEVLRDCAALERLRIRHGRVKFALKFCANLMVAATPLLMIGVGGFLAATGELSVGALVAAVLAQREIGPAVRALINFETLRLDARARHERLFRAAL